MLLLQEENIGLDVNYRDLTQNDQKTIRGNNDVNEKESGCEKHSSVSRGIYTLMGYCDRRMGVFCSSAHTFWQLFVCVYQPSDLGGTCVLADLSIQ